MTGPKAKPGRTAAREGERIPSFEALLRKIVSGKTALEFGKGERIFLQGQPADAVYFIERGKVRISVVSKAGREAILASLESGDFFGEGCLAGQTRRMGSATTLTPTVVTRIAKIALVEALHEQHPLSEAFLAKLLARNMAFEEDICDQLFNHSEKRLARALLKLSRFGEQPIRPYGQVITPKISQEALAEMIGTTRPRVNFFLNKFRRLGLIEYNGEIVVHTELLTDMVLND